MCVCVHRPKRNSLAHDISIVFFFIMRGVKRGGSGAIGFRHLPKVRLGDGGALSACGAPPPLEWLTRMSHA